VWADGVHFNIRLEEDRQCILVLMGATKEGRKERLAAADNFTRLQGKVSSSYSSISPRSGRTTHSLLAALSAWA